MDGPVGRGLRGAVAVPVVLVGGYGGPSRAGGGGGEDAVQPVDGVCGRGGPGGGRDDAFHPVAGVVVRVGGQDGGAGDVVVFGDEAVELVVGVFEGPDAGGPGLGDFQAVPGLVESVFGDVDEASPGEVGEFDESVGGVEGGCGPGAVWEVEGGSVAVFVVGVCGGLSAVDHGGEEVAPVVSEDEGLSLGVLDLDAVSGLVVFGADGGDEDVGERAGLVADGLPLSDYPSEAVVLVCGGSGFVPGADDGAVEVVGVASGLGGGARMALALEPVERVVGVFCDGPVGEDLLNVALRTISEFIQPLRASATCAEPVEVCRLFRPNECEGGFQATKER